MTTELSVEELPFQGPILHSFSIGGTLGGKSSASVIRHLPFVHGVFSRHGCCAFRGSIPLSPFFSGQDDQACVGVRSFRFVQNPRMRDAVVRITKDVVGGR